MDKALVRAAELVLKEAEQLKGDYDVRVWELNLDMGRLWRLLTEYRDDPHPKGRDALHAATHELCKSVAHLKREGV